MGAGGAVVLAPLTEGQAAEADVHLHAHHIVVARRDQVTVERVLSELLSRKRPAVQLADPEQLHSGQAPSAAAELDRNKTSLPEALEPPGYSSELDIRELLRVERTFVCCPLP